MIKKIGLWLYCVTFSGLCWGQYSIVVADTTYLFLQQEIEEMSDYFEQADVALDIKVLPYNRAQKIMAAGEVDGEIGRIEDYFLQFDHITVIEPPITRLKYYLYSRRSKFLQSEDKLKTSTGAFVSGMAIHEVFITQHQLNSQQALQLKNLKSVFEYVAKGRADYFLGDENLVPEQMKKLGYSPSDYQKILVDARPIYVAVKSEKSELAALLTHFLIERSVNR